MKPLRVNCYDVDKDGAETLTASNVLLADCFPDEPEDRREAERDLRQNGRHWGGGGAAPRFLLMAVRS